MTDLQSLLDAACVYSEVLDMAHQIEDAGQKQAASLVRSLAYRALVAAVVLDAGGIEIAARAATRDDTDETKGEGE